LSGFRNCHEEIGEIRLEVTGCGKPGVGFNAHLELCMGDFECTREITERCQPTIRQIPGLLDCAQLVEHRSQFWHNQPGQALLLGCFDENGYEAFLLSDLADANEQNSLPDPPEPEQHHTLRVSTGRDSLQSDAGVRDDLVSTRQCGWARASSRSEWITDWVHDSGPLEVVSCI
jgi:hypothetical protein